MTNYHVCMNVDLDIDMLRCFVEVAQSGSFTKAGRKIGLTQSGVSVKIRRLEERLNSKIFNRTSKQLSLSLQGEMLMDYSTRILAIHDEAVSRLTTPAASGKLRVGLIDYFLPELLPKLLNRFSKQYPNIHLEIQTDVGINLIPLYEKGELDLVVAGKDSYTGHCRVLAQEPLVWVVGSEPDSFDQETVKLVLLPSPCSFRRIAIEGLEKINRHWEVLFTGTNIASIQAAVEAGIGISILPQGALREGLRKAPVQMGLPELPMYSLALIAHEGKPNDARDMFTRYLEAELNRMH